MLYGYHTEPETRRLHEKTAMEEALLKKIRNLIASRIGLLVRAQDDALLRKVVADRARALNLSGVEQYCQFLASDAGIRHEREALVILFTTGETYFFRDSGLHVLLRDRIFPELIERHKQGRALRIWCAACATGEEAYSLAILLDELIGDLSQWNIFILGTDINRHAIEKARRGSYSEWSFRGMSDERRQRYFQRHKDKWVLNDSIRSRVTLQTGDLVGDAFPDHAAQLYDMDLILCRNAFIYMAPNMVFRIADKFTETLAEGGILIAGHGELYAHPLGKLRARVFPESIVYQKVVPLLFAQATAVHVKTDVPEKLAVVLSAVQIGRSTAPVLAPQQVTTETAQETSVSKMQQVWKLANQGQREMAEKSCSELIAKNPLDAEPYYLMALLTQERGNFAEASELLKKVIYLAPTFIAAYLDLGDLYARQDDGGRAVKMRTTARDLLKALPGDQQVKFYGVSTVEKVLEYVEHLLVT